MKSVIEELSADIRQRLAELPAAGSRLLVAIAGPPASGKSTVSEQLSAQLNQQLGGSGSVVLPMDGFHLDNELLDSRGSRSRKGAPHTFDLAGFSAVLQRVAGAGESVIVPLFDRTLDLARAGSREIQPDHRVVLVEGNYLLLDKPGWSGLSSLFDFTVYLEVDEAELSARLIQRWLDHGLDPVQARARAESNDLPNARLVAGNCLPADKRIPNQ